MRSVGDSRNNSAPQLIETEGLSLQRPRVLRALGDRGEAAAAGVVLFVLLFVFFLPATIGTHSLLPADVIYERDPLWQPLAPAGFCGAQNELLADQTAQFFPWRVFSRECGRQGEVPLWNPYSGGGQPFVGNAQSGLFDPLTLVTWFLPLHAGFVATAVSRMWLAGFFMYLFCRLRGLRPAGSFIAALTFMWCGPMVVWVGYPLSSVICVLPALLWATEKRMTTAQPQSAVQCPDLVVSIFVAWQFLGGHPETSFLVLLAWAAYAGYRAKCVCSSPQEMKFRLVSLVSGAVLGTALAAIQLLPFLVTLWHSDALARRGATSVGLTTIIGEWRLWPGMITALLPDFFGSPEDKTFWFPGKNYNELTLYCGVLPLVLALVTVHDRWKHREKPNADTLFWTLLTGVSLAVAFKLPLLNAINELPLFDISNNGRFRLVFALGTAVLAGAGGDLVLASRSSRRRAMWILGLLAACNIVLAGAAYARFWYSADSFIANERSFFAALSGTPYLSHSVDYYENLAPIRHARRLALYLPRNGVMYLPVVVAAVFGLWTFLARRWRRAGGASLILLGLVAGDSFLVWRGYNPMMDPNEVYPTPPALDFLQKDPTVFRVNATGPIFNPNGGMVFGVADIRAYDPMIPRRYVELLKQVDGFYPIGHHHYFIHSDDSLIDLLNVKYLLTDGTPDERWQMIFEDGSDVRVFENKSVIPRAFLVHTVEIVADRSKRLARLADETFDFRRTALLEQNPPAGWRPGRPDPDASVELVSYGAFRQSLRASSSSAGLLIVSDTYMPGWHATLNGEAVPVMVADHALRAIALPAGQNDVVFTYRPVEFSWGMIVTALAVGTIFAAAIYSRSRVRPRPRRV